MPSVGVDANGDDDRDRDDVVVAPCFDVSGIQPDIGPLALNRAAQEGSHPLVDLATQSRPTSGRALTNDSSRLADMRVWLDEKRHRSPAWSGRPGTAGSRDISRGRGSSGL